jgi:hypothetical protein
MIHFTFPSQMFTNSEYELKTASMNSHSNALFLDGVICNLHNNALFCDVRWQKSLAYKIMTAQKLLHVQASILWHTTHHRPNQNKTEHTEPVQPK